MIDTHKYSQIIAGTMTWGSWGKNFSIPEMTLLMHQSMEVGITTFDHADIYGGYTNEAAFGEAYKKSGIPREHMQLISKCGIQYVCENRDNKIKHYNYDKDYIVWSAEQSLQHLKTDYLDLFLLHRPSPLMQPEEIAAAIEQLIRAGKIIDFGVSNFTPAQIALLETAVPVAANQIEYSITSDTVMYDGTLDDCMAHNRMAMAWSPLGSYFREDNEQTKRIRKSLNHLTSKYEADEDQLLLAWLLKHPVGIKPVVGTTNADRLKAAILAANIDLELEDWFIMLEGAQGHKVP